MHGFKGWCGKIMVKKIGFTFEQWQLHILAKNCTRKCLNQHVFSDNFIILQFSAHSTVWQLVSAMSQKVHCFINESPSTTTVHLLRNNKLYIYVCQSWQTIIIIMVKNIVVFEGDTPSAQSTKVMLAATKMCICYCGYFSKTSLI